MECCICGLKGAKISVKSEEGEEVLVCQACFDSYYEGYEGKVCREMETDEDVWADDEEDLDEEDLSDDKHEDDFDDEDDERK